MANSTDELLFKDILHDEFFLDTFKEPCVPVLLKDDPRIDLLKLRLEFSSVYLNNEIFYQNKINELHRYIQAQDTVLKRTLEELQKYVDLATYYASTAEEAKKIIHAISLDQNCVLK